MKSTPTPGPWIAVRESGLRQRIQTAGDKGTLAYMTARPFAHSANFSWGQIEANAQLIASAPDLYKALDALLTRYVGLASSGDCGNWDPETEPEVIAARTLLSRGE